MVKFVFLVLVAVVALPLVVPAAVVALVAPFAVVRARYWVTPRGWPVLVGAGLAVVVGLVLVEVVELVRWGRSGAGGVFFAGGITSWGPALLPATWPWLVANLAAGVLLVPAAWAWHRRAIARRVRERRIPNVVTQERIERARTLAADWTSARRIGVRMNPVTGEIGRTRRGPRLTAPLPHGQGWALGLVNRPTVRGWRERIADVRRVRDWIDERGRLVLMPRTASAARALLIAESGAGKTVLLTDLVLCATAQGWPVFVIDAKGDPADAEAMAQRVRDAGSTAAVGGPWDLFAGNAAQVTEKIMRLLPAPSGAGQHYIDEARGVLGLIQRGGPVTSVQDLGDRLRRPEAFVRDVDDLAVVTAVVDSRSGQTAAGRVWQSVAAALAPLEAWLSPQGWTYEAPGAAVRIMPLSPVDAAQARIGDLMLADLRRWMSARLAAGDKSPVLVVVDEFPQLVTAETDPGDTAAALYETARSAGVGLVLAAQSVAGLSNDEASRRRALSSGAALIVGRSKDPEDVVTFAGTVMRMEASGAATSDELRSGRAQHTYVIPPQDVREAWDGAFWLVQGGGVAAFRALPPTVGQPSSTPATTTPSTDVVDEVNPTSLPYVVEADGGVQLDEEPTVEPVEDEGGTDEAQATAGLPTSAVAALTRPVASPAAPRGFTARRDR